MNARVLINTIDSVKDFVNAANRCNSGDIYVVSGRYVVDAKSIMGIFSLDLTNELIVYSENCTEESFFEFCNDIKKYIVRGN